MQQRLLRSMGALSLTIGVVVATAGIAAAQTRENTTPWGHPDIQGVWDRHSITPLERAPELGGRELFTDAEIAQLEKQAVLTNTDEARQDDKARDVATAYNDFWWDRATKTTTRRTSLIIDPADGRIPPLTAAAQARAATEGTRAVGSLGTGGRAANDPEDRSLWERCVTQGSPRLAAGAYNANIQIFQTPDHVVILHEQIHEARIIPIGNRPHVPFVAAALARRLSRTVGGRHAGGRDDQLQREDELSRLDGRLEDGRAHPQDRREYARLHGDLHRSDHVGKALDGADADAEDQRRDVRVRLPRRQHRLERHPRGRASGRKGSGKL